ncbi:LPXTG cell wall anchor domain-containing protein [Candidatus Dependentiae bacterium]|nr:LPXTG cell wall anchor domain-containing protein [Candidatus Dependentiae bacterium]MBU4387174.1 LPXTG cell wall anchor domain-containing protein [Candidatus Dependentiae bacterium]MCG2755931.1 LPXTG cell wall anchor domain-containing protein [Candidatus Dependentiae bacterium]
MFDKINFNMLDKILPPVINPFKALNNLSQIRDKIAEAKTAAFILAGLLAAILIALIILIFKRRK